MERYTITKGFHFSASHQLAHLAKKQPDHPCARLHGHNYLVELILCSSQLDENGFVVDFGDLAPFGDYLKERLDHRHLNDVLPCRPTAEEIAKHLYGVAYQHWPFCTITVRVSETPRTWASYSEGEEP